MMSSMKYTLLALLLLSPLAFADITELACTYTSTFDPAKGTSETSMGESISISIDSDNKKAREGSNWITYTESGSEVRWSSFFSFKAEDKIMMGYRYRLNRVSGQLEKDFMTKRFPNGIKPEDIAVINDINNYDLGLMHTANCKKVEAIF
jgi:hypothetical protein